MDVRFGSEADMCSAQAHVCFGSEAEISQRKRHVRFAADYDRKSGHRL
jgi:hypothetical protein